MSAPCHPWLRAGNRWVAAFAFLLTLVIFGALFTPLTSSIEKGLAAPVIRVALMQIASAVALYALAKALIAGFRR